MYAATSTFALTSAADGATAGKCWLTNILAATNYVIVRKVFAEFKVPLVVNTTCPRINIERMSYNTAPGGSPFTAIKSLTADGAPSGALDDTTPTAALTAGARLCSFYPPALITAVGSVITNVQDIPLPTPIVLVGGEGLVVRQADAGMAATEARECSITFWWDEIPIGASQADSIAGVRRYYGPQRG